MWAVSPRLTKQPELAIGNGGVLSPAGVAAVHFVYSGPNIGFYINESNPASLQVHLCDRYSFKIWWEYNTQQNGDAVLIGTRLGKDFYYPRAAIYDNDEQITAANLANLCDLTTSNTGVDHVVYPAQAVSVGFAWEVVDDESSLVMYAHVIKMGLGWSRFGARSCSLRATVDEDAALAGPARLVSTGNASHVYAIGGRLGWFTASQHALMETTSQRASHAADRVGYSLSRAGRFFAPAATIGINGADPSAIPSADACGHREFSVGINTDIPGERPEVYLKVESRFPVWLAGQPDSDVAWIPQSASWRANCAFTKEQNTRMSVLKAEVSELRGGLTADSITFTIDELHCTEYGNNEYAGVHDEEFVTTFPNLKRARLFAQVRSTASGFYAQVDAFTAENGGLGRVFRDVAIKSMTESEATEFFDGTPISLGFGRGGTVTLTAIGS